MVWVRLDEDFADHPKIAALGDLMPLAGWLHVCALCYCNRHLTDGFLPSAKVHSLASFRHLSVATGGIKDMAQFGHDIETDELVEALVDVGMWEEAPGGYLLHDYLDYQPSRAEWEAEQKQKSEAGKKGASVRWGRQSMAPAIAPVMAPAMAPPIAESCPVPVPVPVSFSKKKEEEKRKLQAVENPGADRAPSKSEPMLLGNLMTEALGQQP